MFVVRKSSFTERDGESRVTARIERGETKADLWYSVANEWGRHLTTERQDGFLLATLPSAMRAGEDLHIEGILSEKLFYNVSTYYMKLLTIMYPQLRPVRITVDQTSATPAAHKASGVATGFSGGIDSFFVLAEHFMGNSPEGYRVTHCVTNNVGAHGWTDDGQELFRARYARFKPMMEELNLPFIAINSNLHVVLNDQTGVFPQMSLSKMHFTRNMSAVMMLQSLFGRYLYASSVPFESCFVGETYDAGYCDTACLHLLSSESTECVLTGSQYDRVAKTERVVTMPQSYRYLDVCYRRRAGKNCSYCLKCIRTMFTLEMLGKLDLYREVFDLDRFRKIRSRHFVKSLAIPDVPMKEVLSAMRARNYPIPLVFRAAAAFRLWRLWPGSRALIKGEKVEEDRNGHEAAAHT